MIVVREMRPADLRKGFQETLEALAPVGLGPYSRRARDIVSERGDRYDGGATTVVTLVAVDVDDPKQERVVGTASLLIEQKFIHQGGLAGHVEDVAVHPDYQGQSIGWLLMHRLVMYARKAGCYKVVLNCDPKNVKFYEKCGFRVTPDVFMRMDLEV